MTHFGQPLSILYPQLHEADCPETRATYVAVVSVPEECVLLGLHKQGKSADNGELQKSG
jgi:hypothetical protein